MTRAGKLKARPDLRDAELSVRYPDGEFSVKYLPPVILEFLLPDNYPSVRSPVFRIRTEWMNKSQVRLEIFWIVIFISTCVIIFLRQTLQALAIMNAFICGVIMFRTKDLFKFINILLTKIVLSLQVSM